MTDCYGCGHHVTRHTARIFVQPDGQAAKTLCPSCQTSYPYKRQYRPSNAPTRSRYSLSGRGDDSE